MALLFCTSRMSTKLSERDWLQFRVAQVRSSIDAPRGPSMTREDKSRQGQYDRMKGCKQNPELGDARWFRRSSWLPQTRWGRWVRWWEEQLHVKWPKITPLSIWRRERPIHIPNCLLHNYFSCLGGCILVIVINLTFLWHSILHASLCHLRIEEYVVYCP